MRARVAHRVEFGIGPQRRRKGGHCCRIAVVRLGGDDDPGMPGVMACNADGQIVGFRTAAGKHHLTVGRHLAACGSAQLLGIIKNPFLHVPGVAAQGRHLLGDCSDNARMAMPYRHHIIVGVQVLVTVLVVKVGTLGADNAYRLVIEQPIARPQQVGAPLYMLTRRSVQVFGMGRVEAIGHITTDSLDF